MINGNKTNVNTASDIHTSKNIRPTSSSSVSTILTVIDVFNG